MTETRFRQTFLLLLVAAITFAFVAMIRTFVLTTVLEGTVLIGGAQGLLEAWLSGPSGSRVPSSGAPS